jgi:hypothetical protein
MSPRDSILDLKQRVQQGVIGQEAVIDQALERMQRASEMKKN